MIGAGTSRRTRRERFRRHRQGARGVEFPLPGAPVKKKKKKSPWYTFVARTVVLILAPRSRVRMLDLLYSKFEFYRLENVLIYLLSWLAECRRHGQCGFRTPRASQPASGGTMKARKLCLVAKERREWRLLCLKKNPAFYPMVKEFRIETDLKDKVGRGWSLWLAKVRTAEGRAGGGRRIKLY